MYIKYQQYEMRRLLCKTSALKSEKRHLGLCLVLETVKLYLYSVASPSPLYTLYICVWL